MAPPQDKSKDTAHEGRESGVVSGEPRETARQHSQAHPSTPPSPPPPPGALGRSADGEDEDEDEGGGNSLMRAVEPTIVPGLGGASAALSEAPSVAVTGALGGARAGLASLKQRIVPDERSEWNDKAGRRRVKMTKRVISYVLLGISSFILFLYLTFPYGVIKEVAVSKITETLQRQGIPAHVSIGALEPWWFSGLNLENVVITNPTDPDAVIKFGIVRLQADLLPLLWGQLAANGKITQGTGGLDFHLALPLSALLRQDSNTFDAAAHFQHFQLDGFVAHALALLKGSRNPAMAVVLPLISKSSAGGKLSGHVRLASQSKGQNVGMKGALDLRITDGFLDIADETLKIPRQNFNTANFAVAVDNNVWTIGPDTALKSEQLEVALSGKIQTPDDPRTPASADLDLNLTMRQQIEKNLGQLVPLALRCSRNLENGTLHVKLTGPLTNLVCM